MSEARVQVLPASDRRPTPWKNGGGVTHEVAVSPAGASLEDFEWRISLARVSADGPFSTFEGVDRTLLLLRGSLVLRIGRREPRVLRAGMTPVSFRGEDDALATVLDGPVVDLNVMTRRDRCCARLVPAAAATDAGDVGTGLPDWTLFLLDAARAEVEIGSARRALERHDAILASGPVPVSLRPGAHGATAAFHRVELWRRAASGAPPRRMLRGDSRPC